MAGGLTRRNRSLSRRLSALVLALTLGAAACGGEEEPELTFEDLLVELEGRQLTLAEVSERAEVGATLCQLDDQILDELWQQLDEDQLDFQDIVFATLCPERAILYAGHTGRFVTEEAEQSGVRTSTTRPAPTTSTTPATTGTRPVIGPATSAGTTTGTDPDSGTDGGATSSTTSSVTTATTASTTSTTAATSTTSITSSTTSSATTAGTNPTGSTTSR